MAVRYSVFDEKRLRSQERSPMTYSCDPRIDDKIAVVADDCLEWQKIQNAVRHYDPACLAKPQWSKGFVL
jgi:hypothetical protein